MPVSDSPAVSQLRWWLKLPPTNLIERGDRLRFSHALYLITHQVAATVFGLNNLPDEMYYPSRLADARARLDALLIRPPGCGDRLEQIITCRDRQEAWRLASDLITDVLALVDKENSSPLLVPSASQPRSHSPESLAALAKAVAQRIPLLSGIEGVALTGSLARGTADRLSDMDLSVYCRTYPPEKARWNLLASVPDAGDPLIEHACDTVWIDGALAHIRYRLSGDVERMIAAFPNAPEDMGLAEDVQICTPLYDPSGRLGQWKNRVWMLSPRLMAAIVDGVLRRRVVFADLWREAWARRDRLHLHGLANQAANDWIIALFALNHRFLSTPRWSHHEMKSFKVIPNDTEPRLCHIVAAMDRDVEGRWEMLDSLWEELPV